MVGGVTGMERPSVDPAEYSDVIHAVHSVVEVFILNTTQELLTITMEECGELTQECSKIIRFGQSKENLDRLEKEVGDLLCMIDLLHEYDLVRWQVIENQAKAKRNKLKIYSSLIEEDYDNRDID